MAKRRRLGGTFALKESEEQFGLSKLSLQYESGTGLLVSLNLARGVSWEIAEELKRTLNSSVVDVTADDYEPHQHPSDPGTLWLRPLKIIERISGRFNKITDAEKQVYLAVIRGEVRARSKEITLGPEWLKQLSQMTFDESAPFALPPDIQLCVADVDLKWG